MGRISQILDPAGNPIIYGYDAHGDLVSVTDQIDQTATYRYLQTPAHYLEEAKDPMGHVVVRTHYDDQGRLASTQDAVGQGITYQFDVANFTETLTDAQLNVTTLVYDVRGNILSRTDPELATWTYTYDANDNEVSVTDPAPSPRPGPSTSVATSPASPTPWARPRSPTTRSVRS